MSPLYIITLYIILFAWLIWTFKTLNTLLRDLCNIKMYYDEKKWPDFWGELGGFIVAWLFVIVPLVVHHSLGKGYAGGL